MINTPDDEYITYVVVEQHNANTVPNQKRVKIMNTPDDERVYIAVEPNKAGLGQGTNKGQLTTAADLGGAGNLDKVRDILFGNQVRDFDKKFNRLEERLINECESLRDETKKRLDSLEMYVKQEIESLSESFKAEKGETDESLKEIAENLKDTTKSLEKKLAQLDEQINQKQRELRQQILDQSKGLDDEMRQKYQTIVSMVEREVRELRGDKTDRSTLATLFTQLAMQLNSHYDLSGNE